MAARCAADARLCGRESNRTLPAGRRCETVDRPVRRPSVAPHLSCPWPAQARFCHRHEGARLNRSPIIFTADRAACDRIRKHPLAFPKARNAVSSLRLHGRALRFPRNGVFRLGVRDLGLAQPVSLRN